jgi:hypothetical protein
VYHSAWGAEIIEPPNNGWGAATKPDETTFHRSPALPPSNLQAEHKYFIKPPLPPPNHQINDGIVHFEELEYIFQSPIMPDTRYFSLPVHTHASTFPHQTINISPHTVLSPGVINASGQGNATRDHLGPRSLPSHPLEWTHQMEEREREVSFHERALDLACKEHEGWVANNHSTYLEQQKYLNESRHRSIKCDEHAKAQIDFLFSVLSKLDQEEQKYNEAAEKGRLDIYSLHDALDEIKIELSSLAPAYMTVTTAMGTIMDQFTFIIDLTALKHSECSAFYLF